ncbi:MAG: hypothetical protein MUC50_12605 [Myxococcota bacterium]|jgi:hypothetical protein|nr:hypothetical protein [Myxococcota bacterium]
MRLFPKKEQILHSWEKYSLIVIGNVVFFALLYLFSYRPHNSENRASEFLALAQEQETIKRNETALVLYEKVLQDYGNTRAAQTAAARIPMIKKSATAVPADSATELYKPRLDLGSMLDRQPSVYVAGFMSMHFEDNPILQPKLREAIHRYLRLAVYDEKIPLDKIKRESEFQNETIKREFFDIKPKCNMDPDWIYDNFSLQNDNFFPWINVNIKLTVTQGNRNETEEIRLERLESGDAIELLEFRVKKSGGIAKCVGTVTAKEGSSSWSRDL